MKLIWPPTNSLGSLCARKSVWFLTSMAGLLLLAFLLREEWLRPKPGGSSQAQPPVQSNPISHPSQLSLAPVASSSRSAASRADKPGPRNLTTPTKRSGNDESPFRRWQLGTHWGNEPHPTLAAFSSWAQRFVTADQTDRDAMVTEGAELAQQRRVALLELIAADPREALASAVPFGVRQQLPSVVTAQLEQRVSGKGAFLVLATVPREDTPDDRPAILRHAHIGQERFTAHVFGERVNQRTTTDISLHGVAVDGQLALSESPVRLLEPGEPLATNAASAEPICSISGLPAGTAAGSVVAEGVVLAASGNQVHWLCQGGHLEALEHKVQAMEGKSIPGSVVAGAYQSTGDRKILVMLIDFSDLPGGAVSQATAQANLNDVTAFIRSNAFNQIAFPVQDVTPVLRMPWTGASYAGRNDYYQLMEDARSAAALAGYNPNNYDFEVVVFGSIRFPWSGLGYVGQKGCWVQGNFHRGVAAHELGHNLGLWHANAWVSGSIIGSDGTHQEYGNPFDVMGNAGSYPQGHYSANFKFLNGWLPSAFIQTVMADGTYRIYAQDFGGYLDAARKYAIHIPVHLSVTGEREDYWLDFRQGFSSNSATDSGAVLQWGNTYGGQYASRLLDTQPATLGNMQDAPLVVGRTFTDPARSLSITTLAKGGSGTDSYLDIEISGGYSPPVSLGEALDLPDAIWTAGGDQSWSGQAADTHDGSAAAASGAISDNQQTFVETTVNGPGTLTFWWKVSSQANYDHLSFLSDGLVIASLSGEQTWQQRTHSVPVGTHTLRWRYSKNGSVVAGSDRGWLDQVSFAPANDLFANSTAIVGSTGVFIGSNVRATKEINEPDHAGNPGGKSIWWTWTAPSNGLVAINTAGSPIDTLLGIYTGSTLAGLTLIIGNDDSAGYLTSAVRFAARAGSTYQIAVDGFNNGSGEVHLNLLPVASLRMASLEPLADGSCRIWIESADDTAIDPARIPTIEVYASTNPAQPMVEWTRLPGSLTAANGRLWIDDPAARNLPRRFYCASERP